MIQQPGDLACALVMIEIAVSRQPASGNVSRSTTSPFVVDITSHEGFPADEARVQADKLWAQAQTPGPNPSLLISGPNFLPFIQSPFPGRKNYFKGLYFSFSLCLFLFPFLCLFYIHTHIHKFCLALHLIYVALGVFIIMVIMLVMFSEVSPRVQRSLTKLLLALCPPSGSCY